jgi:hypothetical protein
MTGARMKLWVDILRRSGRRGRGTVCRAICATEIVMHLGDYGRRADMTTYLEQG